jgi:hypothetical protein
MFGKTQEVLARTEEQLGALVLVYWNSGGGSVCDSGVLGPDEYPAHSYPMTARGANRIGHHVEHLSPEVIDDLLALNRLCFEMGQTAITDFDENNQHNNRILNVLERHGLFYQADKDWLYRPE